MKYQRYFLTPLLLFLVLYSSSYAQSAKMSFLALGDSYTIGESVSPEERWPVQLVNQLRERGIQVSDPEILAVTGWTTLDLRNAISKADLNPPYDLVSLLIGVNDQYQGKDIREYPGNFRHLLEKAIELSGHRPDHVFVLSIPDYGVTPFGQKKNPDRITEEINRYNTINKRLADSLGVHYFDITPVTRMASSRPELLAEDQLHPSGRMYKSWVEQITPVLLSEIRPWRIK